MKKITGFALGLILILTACNSNSDTKNETISPATTVTDTVVKKEIIQPIAAQLYSCSMHPEIQGKKDEKCSKCGMKLTVPVQN